MLSKNKLQEQVITLSGKPGHEKVKVLLRDILKEQLGAIDNEIDLGDKSLTCRGRIDALWGRTVFEIKRDLDKELSDAKNQLQRYIKSKEKETRQKHVGIATDGQKYIAYSLFKDTLKEINQFGLNKNEPSTFIQWLESVILIKEQLEASPEIICKEIGQESPLCRSSIMQIKLLWKKAKSKSDIRLKYDLWKKSVDIVYGTEGADESLFVEHTYLTIVSKAIAYISFFENEELPKNNEELLNGKPFKNANVLGVVEDDFFSWVVFPKEGKSLIRKIAVHIKRFDFSTIKADILKGLYEGLIRQEQRHKLGEYYTPDWLAEKICKEVIKKPLGNRVIDPSCGSGTFLFHSIKFLIETAKKKNIPAKETISLICEKIAGIDIHPVAVIFSRITYLLAMLEEIKKDRPDDVVVPIYLGDSLQWNKGNDSLPIKDNLSIEVPEDKVVGAKSRKLFFPQSVCQKEGKLDKVIVEMIKFAEQNKNQETFKAWFKKQSTDKYEQKVLSKTYQDLLELQREDRNHIWGYVARNLTRPIWLSSEKQKADVVIGNPPWLKFNSMNKKMQEKFKSECKSSLLWGNEKNNSKFQTSQDISTYFFIKSTHLYMKEKGTLAFVLPYGVINGGHHSNFRKGHFYIAGNYMNIKVKKAWVFDSKVKNLFKTASCVLFSERRKETEEALPKKIITFKGKLPQKNTNLKEADKLLFFENKVWPNESTERSYYYNKSNQGASLVPRRFNFVKKIKKGQLGSSSKTPLVEGVTSNLDNTPPWNNIQPLEAKIESQFLKPVYKGESIAPFRILKPNTGIIPWDDEIKVMNAQEAGSRGYIHLSDYLEKVEKLWDKHSSGKITYKENINYKNKLEDQFPVPELRIVYTASGKNPAAVLLENFEGIIDTTLYYVNVDNRIEGLYLEGVLNSDYLAEKMRPFQPQGQAGERHIHRHILTPFFPKYDSKNPLHNDIVSCSKRIKKIVQNVDIDSSWSSTKSRKEIRQEITNREEWEKLNDLVRQLLESPSEEEGQIQKKRIQKARQKVPKGKQAKKTKLGRNKP